MVVVLTEEEGVAAVEDGYGFVVGLGAGTQDLRVQRLALLVRVRAMVSVR